MLRYETSRNHAFYCPHARHVEARNISELSKIGNALRRDSEHNEESIFIFLGKSVIPNRKMRKPFFIVLTLSGGIIEKYFTPSRGFPINDQIFYKDVTPAGGCLSR